MGACKRSKRAFCDFFGVGISFLYQRLWPTWIFSPGFTLNWKSFGAWKTKTTVDPRLNSPEKKKVQEDMAVTCQFCQQGKLSVSWEMDIAKDAFTSLVRFAVSILEKVGKKTFANSLCCQDMIYQNCNAAGQKGRSKIIFSPLFFHHNWSIKGIYSIWPNLTITINDNYFA